MINERAINTLTILEKGETTPSRASFLGILPFATIVFYNVSGRPFGIEEPVHAAGPFLSICGFAIFLCIWSLPEALITVMTSPVEEFIGIIQTYLQTLPCYESNEESASSSFLIAMAIQSLHHLCQNGTLEYDIMYKVLKN